MKHLLTISCHTLNTPTLPVTTIHIPTGLGVTWAIRQEHQPGASHGISCSPTRAAFDVCRIAFTTFNDMKHVSSSVVASTPEHVASLSSLYAERTASVDTMLIVCAATVFSGTATAPLHDERAYSNWKIESASTNLARFAVSDVKRLVALHVHIQLYHRCLQ